MKTFGAFAAALALVAGVSFAQASPVTVGAITWDPNYSEPEGTGQDYEATFDFTQWYSKTSSEGGYITGNNFSNAQAYGTIAIDLGNYWLQGVGEINSMNSSRAFGGSDFEVTYAFGGIKLNPNSTFNTSAAWFRAYVNGTDFNYTAPTSNTGEVADAQSGLLWIEGTFDSLINETSSSKFTFISAQLNITGGIAQPYFDPTLFYSSSAFFPNNSARYSQGGNGQIMGNTHTVSEPGSLALLGFALLGFAVARRFFAV